MFSSLRSALASTFSAPAEDGESRSGASVFLGEKLVVGSLPVLAGIAVAVCLLEYCIQGTSLGGGLFAGTFGYASILATVHLWIGSKASTQRDLSVASLAVALASIGLALGSGSLFAGQVSLLAHQALAGCSVFVALAASRFGLAAAVSTAGAISWSAQAGQISSGEYWTALGVCVVFGWFWRRTQLQAAAALDAHHRKQNETAENRARGEADELIGQFYKPNLEKQILDERGELDGLWEWDIKNDQVYMSPRWRGLLGYEHHGVSVPTEEWLNLVHPYDIEELMKRMSSHLKGATPLFEYEHRIRQADGAYRWVLSHGRAVHDQYGRVERFTGTQVDVTRLKDYETELYRQATHDRLTGLPNRELLTERLAAASLNLSKHHTDFALVFLDLDGFKYVNDTLGHQTGDALLVEVAERLRSSVREGDVVARVGGDEFVAVLQPIDAESEALAITQRMLERIREPFEIDSTNVSVGASAGLTMGYSGMGHDVDTLMRNADVAMYRAKKGGRGCVKVFDDTMETEASRELTLRSELSDALANDELDLNFQPIICAQTGRIIAAEALMRWTRRGGDSVPPSEFIPLAEDMNLMNELGLWAIERSVKNLSQWVDRGATPFRLAVNLSPNQLGHPDLIERLKDVLKRTGVTSDLLELEITEIALIKNHAEALSNLDRLDLLGVRTAIDDFGTGYSSLSYLKELPCKTLKIDQSFVQEVNTDERSGAITSSIISLAHELKLEVVGEGVETVGQRSFLENHSCDFLQGYLTGRPVTADRFGHLLGTRGALPQGVQI